MGLFSFLTRDIEDEIEGLKSSLEYRVKELEKKMDDLYGYHYMFDTAKGGRVHMLEDYLDIEIVKRNGHERKYEKAIHD
jgi:hypothetical protein